VAFLIFGLLCYLVFLGTFLYACAFVGGFLVPTTLDGEARGPIGAALAVNAALLTLFAIQHSVMARPWFKKKWTRIVPEPIERSTYVLASSLALILLFMFWRPMGVVIWDVEAPAARLILWAMFAFGWGLVLVTTFLLNHFDLFGLRQVWLYFLGRPYTRLRLGTPGPYKLVRHPLYLGWFFAFWSTPTMTLAHLVFALTTAAYILVAIGWEEKDLIHEHGPAYESYRRRVPMLVPGLRLPSRRQSAAGEPAVVDTSRT
jgi:protein-S-isoprenylcysteine O-methyltransferase Ste14